ncbi:MAG: AsmA-like C-terminal region-containing protein [Isosphaerales bacterium]
MRIGRRVAKVVFWGFVLCLSILAGGLWFAYWNLTNSESVARLIREHAIRYFPHSILDPGRVRPSLWAGEVVFRDLQLRQQIDGVSFEALKVPWLHIRINPRKLLKGHLEVRNVDVGQPTLRLRRRRDGTWNLEGLLANPWPAPWIETPPISIRGATLELTPEEEPASTSVAAPAGPALSSLASGETNVPGVGSGRKPGAPAPSASSPLPSPAPAKTGNGGGRSPAILRDVELKIKAAVDGPGRLIFEGSARGDLFDRLTLNGTVDMITGRVTLDGKLFGLTLSETLRRRIPRELRPAVQAMALNNGVVDVELDQFCYDPTAAPGRRLRYQALAQMREGVWECPKLPFRVNDLSALIGIEDGVVTIKHARGSNGQTILRAEGTLGIDDPTHGPLDLRVGLIDLELDQRLRDKTPPEYDDLWDVFKPRGRVSAALHVVRGRAGQPVDVSTTVFCTDVAAVYRYFPYPLDHLTGRLSLVQKMLTVDLQTLVGGKPMRLAGTIQDPGDDAVVKLDIQAETLPIDDVLRKAMPPDVQRVVDQFRPKGVVKAHAKVDRKPMSGPNARPEGELAIDAEIDLGEGCEITWDRLPYPIRNLRGRLEVHPDQWVFKNMRGKNSQATITASGSVEKLRRPKLRNGDDPLKIDVYLQAQELPFSGELREALPPAWRKSWPTINPSGTSDVEAEVHVMPGRPDHTHIVIAPRPESNVRLEVTRSPQPPLDPGGTIELPMEDVRGRFVFDDGKVTMHDVNFNFRGAPVKFSRGTVFLEDSGRFELSVNELWVDAIRFDADLRKKMPPLMAQFALRLDDGHTFRARGDLQIGWTGVQGVPAWCQWKNTLVVFNDNTVKTGIPLEHIQGQLDHVSGWSNGKVLEVQGILKLDSVSLLGQQITQVVSPFHIKNGVAQLDSISGVFLKGEILARDECWIRLDAAPRYHAALSIQGAKLQEYAHTIPGRQSYSGSINAQIELNGQGSDVRNLDGRGDAHITQGDLGELPPVLRLANVVNRFANLNIATPDRPRTPGKTAFDSADVVFRIAHGATTFDPIKFTGNAFTLLGKGTMDPQGNLDLRLNVLWGRDRFHFPLLSDFTREASTPFLIARVKGTPANPLPDIEALPLFSEMLRALGRGQVERQPQ